jgi:hypothetical protein
MASRRRRAHDPYQKNPTRPERLRKLTRLAESSVERLPAFLPVVCRGCGVLLGLAAPDEQLHCWECGQWCEPADDLAAIAEVAGRWQ